LGPVVIRINRAPKVDYVVVIEGKDTSLAHIRTTNGEATYG
jgi:hypothetical protein